MKKAWMILGLLSFWPVAQAAELRSSHWTITFDQHSAVASSSVKPWERRTLYQSSQDPMCPTAGDLWQASPTAVVGSLFSYFESIERYCGAHPFISRKFVTLNLSTGERVNALNLFSEDKILSALAKDPFIAKSLGENSRYTSLNLLIKDYNSRNKDCLLLSRETFQNFTFYDYRLPAGEVALRFSLAPQFADCNPGFIQLGLWIAAPASMKSAFADAKAKNNLMRFMKNYTSYPLK